MLSGQSYLTGPLEDLFVKPGTSKTYALPTSLNPLTNPNHVITLKAPFYSFISVSGSQVSINPTSGEVTQAIVVNIDLTDTLSGFVESISLNVKITNNLPPSFKVESPPGSISSLAVSVGQSIFYSFPQIVDPESDSITVTFSGSPSFAKLAFDADGGTYGVEVQPPYSEGPSSYNTIVELYDGYNRINKKFTLTILNQPPASYIQSGFFCSVNVECTLSLPSPTDPEGSQVQISLQTLSSYIRISGQQLIMTVPSSYTQDSIIIPLNLNDGFYTTSGSIEISLVNTPPEFIEPIKNITFYRNMNNLQKLQQWHDLQGSPVQVSSISGLPSQIKFDGEVFTSTEDEIDNLINQIDAVDSIKDIIYSISLTLSDGVLTKDYSFKLLIKVMPHYLTLITDQNINGLSKQLLNFSKIEDSITVELGSTTKYYLSNLIPQNKKPINFSLGEAKPFTLVSGLRIFLTITPLKIPLARPNPYIIEIVTRDSTTHKFHHYYLSITILRGTWVPPPPPPTKSVPNTNDVQQIRNIKLVDIGVSQVNSQGQFILKLWKQNLSGIIQAQDLKVTLIQFDKENEIPFIIQNKSNDEILIQLLISNQQEISITSQELDTVSVSFRKDISVNESETIYLIQKGSMASNTILPQQSDIRGDSYQGFKIAGDVAIITVYVLLGVSTLLSIFNRYDEQQICKLLQSISFIAILCLVSTNIPPEQLSIGKNFLRLGQIDFLPRIEYIGIYPEQQSFDHEWESLGFGSLNFITNMKSTFIYSLIIIGIKLLHHLFNFLKYTSPAKIAKIETLYSKITSQFSVWLNLKLAKYRLQNELTFTLTLSKNFIIGFINIQCITILLSCLLNLKHLQPDFSTVVMFLALTLFFIYGPVLIVQQIIKHKEVVQVQPQLNQKDENFQNSYDINLRKYQLISIAKQVTIVLVLFLLNGHPEFQLQLILALQVIFQSFQIKVSNGNKLIELALEIASTAAIYSLFPVTDFSLPNQNSFTEANSQRRVLQAMQGGASFNPRFDASWFFIGTLIFASLSGSIGLLYEIVLHFCKVRRRQKIRLHNELLQQEKIKYAHLKTKIGLTTSISEQTLNRLRMNQAFEERPLIDGESEMQTQQSLSDISSRVHPAVSLAIINCNPLQAIPEEADDLEAATASQRRDKKKEELLAALREQDQGFAQIIVEEDSQPYQDNQQHIQEEYKSSDEYFLLPAPSNQSSQRNLVSNESRRHSIDGSTIAVSAVNQTQNIHIASQLPSLSLGDNILPLSSRLEVPKFQFYQQEDLAKENHQIEETKNNSSEKSAEEEEEESPYKDIKRALSASPLNSQSQQYYLKQNVKEESPAKEEDLKAYEMQIKEFNKRRYCLPKELSPVYSLRGETVITERMNGVEPTMLKYDKLNEKIIPLDFESNEDIETINNIDEFMFKQAEKQVTKIKDISDSEETVEINHDPSSHFDHNNKSIGDSISEIDDGQHEANDHTSNKEPEIQIDTISEDYSPQVAQSTIVVAENHQPPLISETQPDHHQYLRTQSDEGGIDEVKIEEKQQDNGHSRLQQVFPRFDKGEKEVQSPFEILKANGNEDEIGDNMIEMFHPQQSIATMNNNLNTITSYNDQSLRLPIPQDKPFYRSRISKDPDLLFEKAQELQLMAIQEHPFSNVGKQILGGVSVSQNIQSRQLNINLAVPVPGSAYQIEEDDYQVQTGSHTDRKTTKDKSKNSKFGRNHQNQHLKKVLQPHPSVDGLDQSIGEEYLGDRTMNSSKMRRRSQGVRGSSKNREKALSGERHSRGSSSLRKSHSKPRIGSSFAKSIDLNGPPKSELEKIYIRNALRDIAQMETIYSNMNR